jgi:release factor glutamine methyltransferase
MEYTVRNAKCEVRKERTPHPAPRTTHMFTYRDVVERLLRAGVESALLDAACLMEAASGVPRWRFILEPERSIASERSGLFESMLSHREAREPIAYILGMKEFWSLSLRVSRGVLIPRPETETLVEAVLGKIRSRFQVPSSKLGRVPGAKFHVPSVEPGTRNLEPGTANQKPGTRNPELRIVDLGTGSGAIALALAMEVPHARIYALERSSGAIRTARRNAEALGLTDRVHCMQGDLFGPFRADLGAGGFDLIVSNPPYIPSGALAELPPEVAAYEPLEAVDGGPDGLCYHRRIIEEAPGFLREDGWLALEIGDGQTSAVLGLIRRTEAFGPAEVRQDLGGRDRVVLARRRARPHG